MEGRRLEGTGVVSPKAYKAYVFDLDGTLFTLPVDWAGARQEVEAIIGKALDRTPLFPQLRVVIAERPELRDSVFSVLDSHELKAAAGARPMNGAIEFLGPLSDEAKLVVVTMQGKAVCDSLFERFEFGELFSARLTREDSLERAEQIRMALKTLGSPTELTLFVGDRPDDVDAARSARVDVVRFGKTSPGEPKPDYAFLNFYQMKDFFL